MVESRGFNAAKKVATVGLLILVIYRFRKMIMMRGFKKIETPTLNTSSINVKWSDVRGLDEAK